MGTWRGGRARERRPAWAVAACLSLLVHAVVVALAAPGPPPPLVARDDEPITVIPLVASGPPPPRPPPPDVSRPPPDPAREAARPRLAALVLPRPGTDATAATPVAPLEPLAPEPTEPAEAPTEPAEAPRILSPREAALRELAGRTPPPPSDEEALEARVDGMLAAGLPPLLNDESPTPRLREDDDGNLVWAHGGLLAKIHPDGSVVFDYRHGAKIEGFEPGEDDVVDLHGRIPGVPMTSFRAPLECSSAGGGGPPTDSAGLGATVRPNFDLNDLALSAVGDDPLAAQKRWFLRQTEELRDDLSAKAHARAVGLAPAAARRRAAEILGDRTTPAAQRRRLLFELWDESEEPSSDDDQRPEALAGARARAEIESAIREQLPEGSAEAYGAAELARLNERRASRRPFAPYRR